MIRSQALVLTVVLLLPLCLYFPSLAGSFRLRAITALVGERRLAPAFTATKIGSSISCTSSFSDKSEFSSVRLCVAINVVSTNRSSDVVDRLITCLQ